MFLTSVHHWYFAYLLKCITMTLLWVIIIQAEFIYFGSLRIHCIFLLIIILRHPYSLTCCYASVAAARSRTVAKDCTKKAVEEQLQIVAGSWTKTFLNYLVWLINLCFRLCKWTVNTSIGYINPLNPALQSSSLPSQFFPYSKLSSYDDCNFITRMLFYSAVWIVFCSFRIESNQIVISKVTS